MKTLLVMLALLGLTGCNATMGGLMENRLACTVAGDKLFVVSEYGAIGVASQIAEADRAKICK